MKKTILVCLVTLVSFSCTIEPAFARGRHGGGRHHNDFLLGMALGAVITAPIIMSQQPQYVPVPQYVPAPHQYTPQRQMRCIWVPYYINGQMAGYDEYCQ